MKFVVYGGCGRTRKIWESRWEEIARGYAEVAGRYFDWVVVINTVTGEVIERIEKGRD